MQSGGEIQRSFEAKVVAGSRGVEGNDDIAFSGPVLEPCMGLRRLAERKAPVNVWPELSALGEIGKKPQIFGAFRGVARNGLAPAGLAREQGRQYLPQAGRDQQQPAGFSAAAYRA